MKQRSTEMDGFDSSDDDEDRPVDTAPLKIDWLKLSNYGCTEDLGITSLPGCRFRDTWRSVNHDIATLKEHEVQEVFVLCTKGELTRYRVPSLLEDLQAAHLEVHHHPFPDGMTPELSDLLQIIDTILNNCQQGRKSIVHCFGGLGRAALVGACLLLKQDSSLSEDQAVQLLRDLRGKRAIQSIKQFNYINEFREMCKAFEEVPKKMERSLSR